MYEKDIITKGKIIEFCETLKRVSGSNASLDSLVRAITHLVEDLPNWESQINKNTNILLEETWGATFDYCVPDEVSFSIIGNVPPVIDDDLIYSVTHYCDIRRYINENESKRGRPRSCCRNKR